MKPYPRVKHFVIFSERRSVRYCYQVSSDSEKERWRSLINDIVYLCEMSDCLFCHVKRCETIRRDHACHDEPLSIEAVETKLYIARDHHLLFELHTACTPIKNVRGCTVLMFISFGKVHTDVAIVRELASVREISQWYEAIDAFNERLKSASTITRCYVNGQMIPNVIFDPKHTSVEGRKVISVTPEQVDKVTKCDRFIEHLDVSSKRFMLCSH